MTIIYLHIFINNLIEQIEIKSTINNEMPIPGVIQYGYCKDRGLFQPVIPTYYQVNTFNYHNDISYMKPSLPEYLSG